MNEAALQELLQNPEYQILKRVPTTLTPKTSNDTNRFVATIIDLETMGLNPKINEIIEIGILSFAFSSADGILEILHTYNRGKSGYLSI